MWQEVYNHERVLTLDEIPFHSHIDNDGDNICEYCGVSITSIPDKTNNIFLTVAIIFSVSFIFITIVVILIVRKNRKINKFLR